MAYIEVRFSFLYYLLLIEKKDQKTSYGAEDKRSSVQQICI